MDLAAAAAGARATRMSLLEQLADKGRSGDPALLGLNNHGTLPLSPGAGRRVHQQVAMCVKWLKHFTQLYAHGNLLMSVRRTGLGATTCVSRRGTYRVFYCLI